MLFIILKISQEKHTEATLDLALGLALDPALNPLQEPAKNPLQTVFQPLFLPHTQKKTHTLPPSAAQKKAPSLLAEHRSNLFSHTQWVVMVTIIVCV